MLFRRYLFSLAATFAALVTSACGGDPAQPPGPPGSGTPASLAVHAGNGQTAAAGTAVATNPAVIVKDAGGAPLSGVTVTFTVDAGGGTIQAGSVQTNASGVASPGTWTLGPTAGAQSLGAKAGTLAKISIAATATAATGGTTQTVPTAGGAITVNTPGSPMNGASLAIPAGALASSATITLTPVSTAGFTLPAGRVAAATALQITAQGVTLTQPAMVTLPFTPVAGKVMLMVFRDGITGATTILPAHAGTATTRTAIIPSLSGTSIFAGARSFATLVSRHFGADTDPTVFMIEIDPANLVGPFDTGYRPGVDDWDFDNDRIALLPFLKEALGAPGQMDPSDGMIVTSLWYFMNQKAQNGPLFKKFRKHANISESNRTGRRWAALAMGHVPSIFYTGAQVVTGGWRQMINASPAQFANEQLTGMKAMMFDNPTRPIPVGMLSLQDDLMMAIVYRIEGNTVYLAVPDDPGATFYQAVYTDQGMTPFTLFSGGLTFNVTAIGGLMFNAVVPNAALAAMWPRVADETIGDSEGWPTPTLHFEDGPLNPATVFLQDPLKHWWQCASCPSNGFSMPDITSSKVQPFFDGEMFGSGSIVFNALEARVTRDRDELDSDTDIKRYGVAVMMPGPGSQVGGVLNPGWLDWQEVTYRRLPLVPNPAAVELTGDETIAFAVQPSVAPPAGTTYSWVLVTDDGRDSVMTTTPSHSRQLDGDEEGVMRITAHEATTRRPLGRVEVPITTAAAAPFWKVTAWVDVDDLVDAPGVDPGQGGPLFDLLWGPEALPGSALIAITGNQLTMRVKRTGTWTECCPPPFGTDDYVGDWPTWSQSTTDLSSGTVTGVWTDGPSFFNFNATRNGKTMTGTMTLIISDPDDETGEIEISTFRFTFTAERMK